MAIHLNNIKRAILLLFFSLVSKERNLEYFFYCKKCVYLKRKSENDFNFNNDMSSCFALS